MKKLAGIICLLCFQLAFCSSVQAQPKQHGLVVGINDYVHLNARSLINFTNELTDLEGAVNDAVVISESLRAIGVSLPDNRILLDRNATLKNFMLAWTTMLDDASPGDTIVLTFSGHGAREKEVGEPYDELIDGKDETIMFADFNPNNPRQGRLNDDQLNELLKQASDYEIVLVMDSCHAAGLDRSVSKRHSGLSRNGGEWDIAVEPLEGEIISIDGDNQSQLSHVTRILGTASEKLQIQETSVNGKPHGAMSSYFAHGIISGADQNQDGGITRNEISSYLKTRVMAHMDQTQEPVVFPATDNHVVLRVRNDVQPIVHNQQIINSALVRVKVIGPSLVDFDTNRVLVVNEHAELTFEFQDNQWMAYNHIGDLIKTFNHSQRAIAHQLAERTNWLRALEHKINPQYKPVNIKADQDYSLHSIGDEIGFNFSPATTEFNALTLFNLPGDGTLQFFYPIGSDSLRIDNAGYKIEFRVGQPTGSDQLIAIFCKQPASRLHNLLHQYNNKPLPSFTYFDSAFENNQCQIGRVALVTQE